MATLALSDLHKSFGTTEVLTNINLAIKDKEFVVFVGPSGCGKSTLLRIIAGLEEASRGAIMIDGADVSDLAPVDRGISMVFQSYALYPHLTVFENIAFPLRVQKVPEPELKSRVEEAARILQLEERLAFKPGALSGGQRQRVAIGRSIVRNPKIFLFDEPLSNLDAALRGDMRVELARLHRELDATMVYVTHDQVEAMTMAVRIVVLSDGRVEQFGTPMDLYHHPETRFVAGFIGHPNMNFVGAEVTGVDASGVAASLPGGSQLVLPVDGNGVSAGDRIDIGIRPEAVGSDGNVAMSLRTDVIERLGGVSITYGALPDGTRFCASLPGDTIIADGAEITVSVDPNDCHAFTADGRALRRRNVPAIATGGVG